MARVDLPTKLNIALYKETIKAISELPNVKIVSDLNDYELISVLAPGKVLIDVINIVLKRGIAE
jgi:hypothetical protein